MKFLPYLIFLAFLPNSLFASALEAHTPVVTMVDLNREQYGFDKKLVSEKEALLIANFSWSQFGNSVFPIIFRIPNTKKNYIVRIYGPISKKHNAGDKYNFGPRFVHLSKKKNKYQIEKIARSAGDSYILRPRFYLGENNVLVLAEQGTEYYWGMSVYNFKLSDKQLEFIGYLDVGKPSLEDPDSPIEDLKIFSKGVTTQFRFYTDLIKDPGGKKETYLYKNSGYISYILENKKIKIDKRDYSAKQQNQKDRN